MNIVYREETKTFYLNTKNTTYAFFVNETLALEHLYYGSTISNEDLRGSCFRQDYSFASYDGDVGCELSPNLFFQEFPTANSGDHRICALNVLGSDGKYGTRLEYLEHTIYSGRKPMKGLPFSDGKGADSLEIVLRNQSANIEVHLFYVV